MCYYVNDGCVYSQKPTISKTVFGMQNGHLFTWSLWTASSGNLRFTRKFTRLKNIRRWDKTILTELKSFYFTVKLFVCCGFTCQTYRPPQMICSVESICLLVRSYYRCLTTSTLQLSLLFFQEWHTVNPESKPVICGWWCTLRSGQSQCSRRLLTGLD